MLKELIAMIYNSKEHRIRGSFITATVTAIVWFINVVVLYLIFHQVMSGNEKLASLAVFTSIWLGFVKIAYVYITTTYMNNKSRIELEETHQRLRSQSDTQPPLREAKNDVSVDPGKEDKPSDKDTMYER